MTKIGKKSIVFGTAGLLSPAERGNAWGRQ